MRLSASATDILNELERSATATFALARALLVTADASRADDEDWARIPAPKAKCPVSRWSRSTILRHIEDKHILGKRVRNARFYSLRSVREFLREAGGELS